MKLTRIEGPPQHLVCAGCGIDGTGGSDAYIAASTGEERTPDEWYLDDTFSYCAGCAAKMVETDPTRAVNQFYSDTSGKEIKFEVEDENISL